MSEYKEFITLVSADIKGLINLDNVNAYNSTIMYKLSVQSCVSHLFRWWE